MTKTVRIKKILSFTFAVVILVCTFLFTATSASAAENTPETIADTMYENCNVYVESDVYPVVVHYVVYRYKENTNILDPVKHIIAEEYDTTLNSAEEFLTLPVNIPNSASFIGGVITSIKCQGYSPATCSVSFDDIFHSWEGNLLSVNKFDKAYTYFNGYAVEDTSSKTIKASFLGGYDNGYSDGYEKGVQDGYDTGYDYGFRIGQAGGEVDTDDNPTDTPTTENEDWKTMLGIGAVLILLALIVLGVSKVSKEIK